MIIAARDKEIKQKDEKIKSLEDEIKKLQDRIAELKKEIDYMKPDVGVVKKKKEKILEDFEDLMYVTSHSLHHCSIQTHVLFASS